MKELLHHDTNVKQVSIKTYKELQEEFEEFAYIISHDLTSPLSHIKQFSKILMTKLGDKAKSEEQQYIDILEKSIEEVEAKFDVLLAYSRLNTNGEPFSEVNCTRVVRLAKEQLHNEITDSKAKITVGNLPTVFGKESQLVYVFTQLIENAIKFANPNETLEININASRKAGVWQFTVVDNGIGIKPTYQNQIFKQLDPESTPGTGSGLALCKKIAHLHDGEIYIESDGEQGSTFTVTIPSD